MRVLLVEDDPSLRAVLARSLSYAGYDVDAAASVSEARERSRQHPPDLALLDVTLPDGSGFELAEALQPHAGGRRAPVIFVTARDSVDDRLTGFALGGDDYVTKPFSVAELLARIAAVLRRSQQQPSTDSAAADELTVADLRLSVLTHEVYRGDREIALSPTEFRLLELLLRHRQQVLTKDQLLLAIWGYETGDPRLVEKFISQLRRKVHLEGGEELIHTVRGFGYVLRAPKQGRGGR